MQHTPKSCSGKSRVNSHVGYLIIGPSLWFRAKAVLFLVAGASMSIQMPSRDKEASMHV